MTIDLRAAKWLVIALFVSVAINMFLGGLFVGRHLQPEPETAAVSAETRATGGRPLRALLQRMAAKLEPEDRQTFRAAVQEHRVALRTAGARVAEARRNLRRTLTADAFDRGEIDAAFAEVRTRTGEFHEVLQVAVSDAVGRLGPEARRRLAN